METHVNFPASTHCCMPVEPRRDRRIPMTPRWTRSLAALALATLALAPLAGCAFGEFRPDDPFRRQLSLEDAQRAYTNYVRWNQFGDAARFVDPELRDAYLDQAPSFRDFRFTDWEATPVILDEEKRTSTIRITYQGYRTTTLVEVPVEETQEWYRDGVLNEWFVRPTFVSPALGLAAAEGR